MAQKNVLIFPCGSEIGLDIFHSLKYSIHFHLIGASSVDDHGKFLYEDYISGLPYANSPEFIPALKKIVQERKIDAVYPTMDSVITILKENEAELGVKVVAPPVETTQICLSKELTYKVLESVVRLPKSYSLNSVDTFPVFVKPKVGYGAIGTRLVHDAQALEAYMSEHPDYMILEYLPGEEYTVDCFTDRHGRLLYSAGRGRRRIKSGVSVNTAFEPDQQQFRSIAEKINSTMSLRGAWFFQVKRNCDGELTLMEVAARLGGSSLLSKAVGVNFPMLSLFDAFDYDVTVSVNDYYVELDRALSSVYKTDLSYGCVYVDYDDCLVLEKTRVNVQLVAFLYDCVNRGIKVTLLSRHAGDLELALKKHRLDVLFDQVIHIKDKTPKSTFIKENDAIFIDDSWAERNDVRSVLGIPVFSPDMVDVLI